MSLGSAIYDKLVATEALTALVSTRIYPTTAPQGVTGSYIIWQQIGADPATTHNETTGSQFNLVQFVCLAPTYEAAVAIREALKTALDNVALSTGDKPTFEDERDGYEDAVSLFRCDADFLI